MNSIQNHPVNKANYNPYLDGLRGIAVLMVMGYHYFTGLYFFDFGWTGVDLFFVLSGYLLSGRLYPYLADKKLVWKFYFNRFLRIVPLYYIFLAVFFTAWFYLASADTINSVPAYRDHPMAFFFFYSNWLFVHDNIGAKAHLNHLWSVATEEQFYIIFPLLVLLIKKKKHLLWTGILLITIIAVSRFWCFMASDITTYYKIYYNSFFRADAFLAGFVLYMAVENGLGSFLNKHMPYICAAAFILLFAGSVASGSLRLSRFSFAIGFTITAVFYSSLVFFAVSPQNNILKKITANRFLRFSGSISYALYIFHWPFYLLGFSIINFVLQRMHLLLSLASIQLINILLVCPLTYLVSYFSSRYYESYFLKWKLVPRRKNI